MTPELDHLVVVAPSLAAGADWVAERLGARPVEGGRHDLMGTANLLLGLGPRSYLEVIAVDPDAPPPGRPRWFGLDDVRVRRTPQLLTWVARTDDLDGLLRAAGPVADALGDVVPASRGDLRWRITLPRDGRLVAGGVVPSLIEWSGRSHPADALPAAGVSLLGLDAQHPDPASPAAVLAALGVPLPVRVGARPRLAADVATPCGDRRL